MTLGVPFGDRWIFILRCISAEKTVASNPVAQACADLPRQLVNAHDPDPIMLTPSSPSDPPDSKTHPIRYGGLGGIAESSQNPTAKRRPARDKPGPLQLTRHWRRV